VASFIEISLLTTDIESQISVNGQTNGQPGGQPKHYTMPSLSDFLHSTLTET